MNTLPCSSSDTVADACLAAITLYLPPEKWHAPFVLDGAEAHHLVRVLRARAGDTIRLMNGQGREGLFCITHANHGKATLCLVREWHHPAPDRRVILAAGWTKAARRGFFLEKAVEFEAQAIWLWQAARSQFPVPSDIREAWQAQLIAGAKQCQNPWLPELRTFPGGLSALLGAVDALPLPVHRHLLVEAGCGPASPLTPDMLGQPGTTVCVIGPEGGFAPAEVTRFLAAGFMPLTLGDRILRWETAAVFCLGLHWWKRQQTSDHGL